MASLLTGRNGISENFFQMSVVTSGGALGGSFSSGLGAVGAAGAEAKYAAKPATSATRAIRLNVLPLVDLLATWALYSGDSISLQCEKTTVRASVMSM